MITRSRIFDGLLGGLLVTVVIYYGLVHWRVIWLVEPATARETAYVANVNGYLDPLGPRPYTLASLPGHTNLYGIGYVWGAAPFAAILPFNKAVNLRIGNAFYLGVMLLALGYSFRRKPWRDRIFALVLVYALYVSSPSIAASPDILACVLYVLAWLVVAESNFKTGALCLSILLGFLALLTKPYLVLVVPVIATYLVLFRSIRSGSLYALGAIGFFGAGLWLIHVLYPYYFVSVFSVHWAAATRDPVIALEQWIEFLGLALVPFVLAILLARRWLRDNAQGLRLQLMWSAPLIRSGATVSLYAWGAVIAATALAMSLSWHEGAYMIYFLHLLLPLLVLLQMRHPSVRSGWLSLNLLVLIVLRPPLPALGTPEQWLILQEVVARHPRMYLDPYLQALRPALLGYAGGENAQSEFLLTQALRGSDDSLRERTRQFLHAQQREFKNQVYDGILLTEGIFFHNHQLPAILSRYKATGMFKVHSYYFSFRHRRNYGRSPRLVMLYEPVKDGPMASKAIGSASVPLTP